MAEQRVEMEQDEALKSDDLLKHLLEASTKTGPPSDMSLQQLAIVIKYHVGLDSQTSIRTKFVESVPILGLYEASLDTLLPEKLTDLAKRSDSDVRHHLSRTLPLPNLVQAWEKHNKSSDGIRKNLWDLVMTQVSNPTYLNFPPHTGKDVQELVVRSRCKEEASFLQYAKRDNLVSIIQQSVPETKEAMYLNMDKKRLCEMVADLNFITRSKTASAIDRCAKDLKEYQESGLSMQNPTYGDFSRDMEYFQEAVKKWKMGEQRYMQNKDSGSLMDLHNFRKHLEEWSAGCSDRISAARKAFLKEKQAAGEKLSFKESLQRYF